MFIWRKLYRTHPNHFAQTAFRHFTTPGVAGTTVQCLVQQNWFCLQSWGRGAPKCRYQYYIKIENGNKDWWLMVIIPTLRSLRQEGCSKFDVNLRYTMSCRSDRTTLKANVCCLYLVCIYIGCLIHQNLLPPLFHYLFFCKNIPEFSSSLPNRDSIYCDYTHF